MVQGNPHQIFYPPPESTDPAMNNRDRLVFGAHARTHPITGMVLEMGSGAHSPDDQARLVHLPFIAATQGTAAAAAMKLKLDAAARREGVKQSLHPPIEGRPAQASD
jgi:hypothetical protein